jgi:hypothetical protein
LARSKLSLIALVVPTLATKEMFKLEQTMFPSSGLTKVSLNKTASNPYKVVDWQWWILLPFGNL